MSDEYGTLDDLSLIGRRLRLTRHARHKSIEVTAGLAGISTGALSELERGLRNPTLTQVLRLAQTLEISPGELMRSPVPAPGNGGADAAVQAVRVAFDAIDSGCPEGVATSVEVLAERVASATRLARASKHAELSVSLPALIGSVHTTLMAGKNHREVLRLAVYLHTHVTHQWLDKVWAPVDLGRHVVFLARRLARERGDRETIAMAQFGVWDVLGTDGVFDLAITEWDRLEMPPTDAGTSGLVSALWVIRALLAVCSGSPGDAVEPIREATAVADRFGEVGESDPWGFGWGPSAVGFRRVRLAIEAGDPQEAVRIAEGLRPEENPFPDHQAYFWVNYGHALAQLPGRTEDTVRALRRAEVMNAWRVQRDPFARDCLAQLVTRARHDAVGAELRGMAFRAGVTA